jgi:hypothetical protein
LVKKTGLKKTVFLSLASLLANRCSLKSPARGRDQNQISHWSHL